MDIFSISYDLIVVGAGPAGSSAARVAAEAGASVLLLEQKARIGSPVQCAEFVPAKLAKVVTIEPRHTARRIRSMKVYLPDGQRREREMAEPGYMLNRELFDRDLAGAAWLAGAKLAVATKVTAINPEGVTVKNSDGCFDIKASVIIGADGPYSMVGKYIGQINSCYLRSVQCEAVWDQAGDSIECYFDSVYEGGYAWVFPKETTANIGVCCRQQPVKALQHFLGELGLGRERIVGWRGGMLPAGGPLPVTVKGNCLLVGDAAGQLLPLTWEGIRCAIVCGMVAGKFAAEAALSGDLTRLQGYQERWQSLFLPQMEAGIAKHRYLLENWSTDAQILTQLLETTCTI